jgi:hypothetical protein
LFTGQTLSQPFHKMPQIRIVDEISPDISGLDVESKSPSDRLNALPAAH